MPFKPSRKTLEWNLVIIGLLMGIFDFFKSKPDRPADTRPVSPTLPSEDDGPTFEYVLAHLALRHLALGNPLQFLGVLASPDAKDFIQSVIDDVVEKSQCPATFDAASVNAHPTRIHSFPCAILEFPPPEKMAEAFMVALVVFLDLNEGEPSDLESVEARYFTLEKGFTSTNEPRTVLCEWTEESHLNYGDGPAPTVEEFIAALGNHIG